PPLQPALEGDLSPVSPDEPANSSALFPIQPAPGRVEASHAGVETSPPERFALHVTIDRVTHDRLRYAQALLSHCVSSGDVAEVLDRALILLIERLEGRKFGAATKPREPRPGGAANSRGSQRTSARKRHIPAHVRRAVWARDQGQCTFVGENGDRCQARKLLEFDHVDPVARGGRSTVDRMRLR